MKSVEIISKGRVQGVFYRASTKTQADILGISGWVRNEANGDVKILAQGDERRIDQLIEWCKVGPEYARVEKVEVKEVSSEDISGFNIRH